MVADIRNRTALAGGCINLAAGSAIAALQIFQYLLLPLLFLPAGLAWAWLLLPATLLTMVHWNLIHEAVHDGFHPDPRLNALAGRGLSVLFGAPFFLLRFGHLIHHARNRTESDRSEVYDPATTHPLRAALGYYAGLVGGFYLAEILAGLLLLLPRRAIAALLRRLYPRDRGIRRAAERRLLAPRILRRARFDAVLVALLFTGAFLAYGAAWPVLLAALAGRGLIISVFDNLYHYGTPLGGIRHARDLHLPASLAWLVLNGNFHGLHHLAPKLPWHRLPAVAAQRGRTCEGSLLAAALRQFRGPIAIGAFRPPMPRGPRSG